MDSSSAFAAPPPPRFVTLRDGSRVVLRPLEPADEPLLREGFARLGRDSVFKRFLGVPHLGDEAFAYLCHPDQVDHLALGAECPEPPDGRGRGVAIARSIRVREEGEDVSEVAIAVADEWQRLGIGRRVLDALAAWAWRSGVRRWYALSTTDNEGIQRALERVAEPLHRRIEGPGALSTWWALRPPDDAPG